MKEVKKDICFLMKWVLSILALLFFILIEFQFAEGKILSIQGKKGFPYFDLQGNFNIVYINSYGGIGLATVQEQDYIKKISIQDIYYADNVNFIRTKKDKKGGIWLVWEERESGKSDIHIAQLRNKRILYPINLTANQKGFNFSPSIDFSFRNELWIAWINYFHKKYTIMIKNVTTGQIWEINSSLSSSALSPHIIIDGTEKIWLFWVGQLRGRDEILYTHFDGLTWRKPLSLNQHSNVPHLSPSISLDFNGLAHIVWSAYDGYDYELYYSYWDGNKWIEEKKITNNQNIADTSPSISLLFNTIPIVAWSRDRNQKREVFLTYKIGDRWSPEINISRNKSINNPPKLVSLEDRIGVLWQVKTEIKIALIHFRELYESFFSKNRAIHVHRILGLNRDKYIGFGNSITYGTIDYEDAPEKGYIPRLEQLIDENIKDSEVVNRGVSGEKTDEGLSRIYSVINEAQAETMFLMEGTNDVEDIAISIDTAAFNLREMAERCLNFGMAVFLASIIPKDPWWDEILKERILELNKKIKAIASELSIFFVDQFEVFSKDSDKNDLLYSDATHPNEQGYQLMAEAWYDALVKTLPSIEISKTSLSFEGRKGKSNPSSQTFEIRNSGAAALNYNISADQMWISLSPASGDSNGEWDEIQVSVDISNLSPGNHQGNVFITSEYAPNSPQILTVELTVLSPVIELDKTFLSFEGIKGESNPPPQTFKIRNSGDETLNYQISADQEWISVSPSSGDSKGEWDEIEVSVNISNLSPGNYQGNVTATSENASNSPQIVKIELAVLSPAIELDKTSLSFEGIKGESNPSLQILKIRNSGAGTLNYQISDNKGWISVSPSSGDSKGEWDEIEVSVNISNLSPGNYQGNVTATSENASNSPQIVKIELTVLSPAIELDKTSLSFEGTAGESNPSSQIFKIRNSGAGTLNYQISNNRGWISVSPESGESKGEWDEIKVSVDISNLTEDNYQANITITSEYASNSPQELTVNLTIQFPPLFQPLNFHGEKKKNRSLSQLEYINVLAWEANPKNNNIIEKYKIYLVEGANITLLKEFDPQTFEYWHRKVKQDKIYKYGLTAVNIYRRESEPVYIEVR